MAESLTTFLEDIARDAGEYAKHLPVEVCGEFDDGKKSDEVVTADRLLDEYLRERITQEYHGHMIISEEGGTTGTGQHGFIIDPLDGSGNFAGVRPGLDDTYGISVAYFTDEGITDGVVHFPAKGKTVTADQQRTVSAAKSMQGLTYSGGHYKEVLSNGHCEELQQRMHSFDALADRYEWDNKASHCATFDIVRTVLDDDVDFHWSASILYLWDVAAAKHIIESEGLKMANLNTGEPVCMDDFTSENGYANAIGAVTGPETVVRRIVTYL